MKTKFEELADDYGLRSDTFFDVLLSLDTVDLAMKNVEDKFKKTMDELTDEGLTVEEQTNLTCLFDELIRDRIYSHTLFGRE